MINQGQSFSFDAAFQLGATSYILPLRHGEAFASPGLASFIVHAHVVERKHEVNAATPHPSFQGVALQGSGFYQEGAPVALAFLPGRPRLESLVCKTFLPKVFGMEVFSLHGYYRLSYLSLQLWQITLELPEKSSCVVLYAHGVSVIASISIVLVFTCR